MPNFIELILAGVAGAISSMIEALIFGWAELIIEMILGPIGLA